METISFEESSVLFGDKAQDIEINSRYYSTSMFVTFESYTNQVAKGTLNCLYLDKTFQFCGLDQLLLIMEDIMDFVKSACPGIIFPQAAMQHRKIEYGVANTVFQSIEDTDIAEVPNKPPHSKNIYACVAIVVCYRQNASMQGFLRVVNRQVAFRSGLELQRLLHQALALASKKD